MIYTIKNVGKNNIEISDGIWGEAQVAKMDNYVWDETGFKPQNFAMALAGSEGITVLLSSDENPVTATKTEFNSEICEDSCLEVFINANPEHDNRYFNFEISASGAFLVGFGSDRYDRSNIFDVDPEIFCVETNVADDGWCAKIFIPYDFLESRYGMKIGKEFKGNFYKCGDKTPIPHFGTWAPVVAPEPDYHRPECFGTFIVE